MPPFGVIVHLNLLKYLSPGILFVFKYGGPKIRQIKRADLECYDKPNNFSIMANYKKHSAKQKEALLYQQIGQLQMELEWLNHIKEASK